MLWHFLRYWVTFAYPVFYKRIQGKNVDRVKVKGPVVIAMNHPNAFNDPVAITFVSYPLRLYYLARGDAFKPGLISKLLESLGIVPIFRIQDGGREGLKKNDEAFRRVNELLKQNKKIIVFLFFLCIQERRLRPLKKGVARMMFGAYNYLKNDELIVLPVGVNYSQPDKLRSTLFYNFGEPIYLKDFAEEFKINEAKAYNRFLQVLEPRMKDLITHINNKEYDDTVKDLELMLKPAKLKEQGLDGRKLDEDFIVTKQVTEMVNKAEIENKELLDVVKEKTSSYLKEVRRNGMRDWLIDPLNSKRIHAVSLGLRFFLIVLALPFYLTGLLLNIIPFKLTEKLTKKVLKGNREFYSSIAVGFGMILLMINYLLIFFIVYHFSPNILCPILSCMIAGITGMFALDFHFYILKTLGIKRALSNPVLFRQLAEKRAEILSLINKF